jgi:glutaminyl-peptide cyclotransferase
MSTAAHWITAALCCLSFAGNSQDSDEEARQKFLFSGEYALQHIAKQVNFGPRIIGHPAKQQTLDYVKEQLLPEADKLVVQPFQRHGLRGNNIWASFYPTNNSASPRNRIMLGAHWDTRPISDRDSNQAHKAHPVIGANDGASGVAVLLEIARLLSNKRAAVIVDLVFFDLEDMGEIDNLPFSIGATEFVAKNRFYRPIAGVIADMVCDRDLVIPRESYSRDRAPKLQDEIWRIAAQQQATAFIDRDGTYINDDHLPFLKAGLKVVNLIHWPFPQSWHTSNDSVERCSSKSLQQVGNVLEELIYTIDSPY